MSRYTFLYVSIRFYTFLYGYMLLRVLEARHAHLRPGQELAGRAWHGGGGGLKLFPWMGSFSLPGIRLYSLHRSPQILIECGPADAELASQRGFRFARFNTTP